MWKAVAGLLIVGLCLVASPAPTWAAQETVTGKVVCLVCYARNKANTELDHDDGRLCAIACVKWEGNPVGLVTADGKVYQFTGGLTANNNAKIAPHLAHTVTVTGEVSVKDGMMMLSASDVTMAPKK
jgi:hypothetical protein